jgi:hypothetical protein
MNGSNMSRDKIRFKDLRSVREGDVYASNLLKDHEHARYHERITHARCDFIGRFVRVFRLLSIFCPAQIFERSFDA